MGGALQGGHQGLLLDRGTLAQCLPDRCGVAWRIQAAKDMFWLWLLPLHQKSLQAFEGAKLAQLVGPLGLPDNTCFSILELVPSFTQIDEIALLVAQTVLDDIRQIHIDTQLLFICLRSHTLDIAILVLLQHALHPAKHLQVKRRRRTTKRRRRQ